MTKSRIYAYANFIALATMVLVLAALGTYVTVFPRVAFADTIVVTDEVVERTARSITATLTRPSITRLADQDAPVVDTTTSTEGNGGNADVGDLDIPAEDGSDIFTDGELPDPNGAGDMADDLTPTDSDADLPSQDGSNGTPGVAGESTGSGGASISSTILADMDLLTTLLEIYHRVSTR